MQEMVDPMNSLRFFELDGQRYHLVHNTGDDSRAIADWQVKPLLKISSGLQVTGPADEALGHIASKGEHWFLFADGEEHRLASLDGHDSQQLEASEVEAAKILLPKVLGAGGFAGVSAEDLVARQRLLESEIQANVDENSMMQAELEQIYAEQDRRRG